MLITWNNFMNLFKNQKQTPVESVFTFCTLEISTNPFWSFSNYQSLTSEKSIMNLLVSVIFTKCMGCFIIFCQDFIWQDKNSIEWRKDPPPIQTFYPLGCNNEPRRKILRCKRSHWQIECLSQTKKGHVQGSPNGCREW